MGILDYFRKKQIEKMEKHQLSEEDRLYSIERRQLNSRLKRAKQDIELAEARLRLEELNDRLSEYTEDSEEDTDNSEQMLLMQLISNLRGKQENINPVQNNIQKIDLSNEQIESLYSEYKKYIKFAKSMSDEQIKAFILNRMPDLSDDSLMRIISRIRQ